MPDILIIGADQGIGYYLTESLRQQLTAYRGGSL